MEDWTTHWMDHSANWPKPLRTLTLNIGNFSCITFGLKHNSSEGREWVNLSMTVVCPKGTDSRITWWFDSQQHVVASCFGILRKDALTAEWSALSIHKNSILFNIVVWPFGTQSMPMCPWLKVFWSNLVIPKHAYGNLERNPEIKPGEAHLMLLHPE